MSEAGRFADAQAEFQQATGLAFSFIVVIYEDKDGQLPGPEAAARYAEAVGLEDAPVLADVHGQAFDATPFSYGKHPSVCILTPQMEMQDCVNGHGEYDTLMGRIALQAGR